MRCLVVALLVGACGRVGFDGSSGAGDAPPLDAIPTSLVAWYPMESVAANTVVDATGHGHDGTCAATCPAITSGRVGSALSFNGTTDRIDVPAPASVFGTPQLTVAWWLLIPAPTPSTFCPVNKVIGATIADSWQLVVYSPGLGGQYITSHVGTTTDTLISPGPVLTFGAWHHLALTWDGVTKTIWVDGAAVVSDTPATELVFDDQPIAIGADIDSGSSVCQVAGAIDEVRIYSTALSGASIQALAQ